MDYKLELVLLPVSDADRAKAFYAGLGFKLDVDHHASGHDAGQYPTSDNNRACPGAGGPPPPGGLGVSEYFGE